MTFSTLSGKVIEGFRPECSDDLSGLDYSIINTPFPVPWLIQQLFEYCTFDGRHYTRYHR
jgi:hypothetical protein